jgi:ketosteroid isomerase-like protein
MAATIAAADYASSVAESDVELIRQGFEDLANVGYEALLPLIAPDFELTTPPQLSAEPDTYRGPAGIGRYFESFYDAMDEIHFEPLEFREVGEWIVVPFKMTARGRSTGLEVEQQGVMAWQVRNELAVRLDVFAELEDALRTVGFQLPAWQTPLSKHLPATRRIEIGDVDDRGRRPGQLAAVDRQVGGGDDLL